MNALKKFGKHNDLVDVRRLKFGTTFKNYYPKNKYVFNEIYKEKLMPTEELVFLITRILKHKSKYKTSQQDMMLKKIAEGFVRDHHELFPDLIEGEEATDDEYEGDKPKILIKKENMSENHDEKPVENHDEKPVENHVKNDDHLNAKLEELKEDITKKFNDMIDAHLDLRKMIEEKRNISNQDAKSRLENMEGKIEMLYGKQMSEPKKQKSKNKSKDDVLKDYLFKNI